MWFIGLAHPQAPVVGLVGRDLQAHDPAQLFALLDALNVPAPDSARAWANLAQCYDTKHDVARMHAAAQRAQQLEPGEPLTAALLGRS